MGIKFLSLCMNDCQIYFLSYTADASKAKRKKSNRASKKRRQESRTKKKLLKIELPILEMISKENSSSGENRSENLTSRKSPRWLARRAVFDP